MNLEFYSTVVLSQYFKNKFRPIEELTILRVLQLIFDLLSVKFATCLNLRASEIIIIAITSQTGYPSISQRDRVGS